MSDKKSRRRTRREESPEKPTKEEYAIAKFLRFNVPNKVGKLHGMEVTCFTASDAVDKLLESKWGKGSDNILFGNRHSAENYCHRLLEKGIYHRALKVDRKKERERKKKKKELEEKEKEKEKEKEAEEEESVKEIKGKKEKKKKGKDKDKEKDAEKNEEKSKEVSVKDKDTVEEKKDDTDKKDDDKKKKKDRKVKLTMHDHQLFKDGDDIYVWIYDPVPVKTFIIGLLLVLGAIGVCLFPLWPPEVRQGVYYLSLAAAAFVGVILSLCVVRFILFCGVWLFTMGKHHFWFLPNLTEDVGFFDSFKPLYKHEIKESTENNKNKTDKNEGESQKEENKNTEEVKDSEGEGETGGESGSEGQEDENGYEMVEKEDLEGQEEEVEDDEPKKTK